MKEPAGSSPPNIGGEARLTEGLNNRLIGVIFGLAIVYLLWHPSAFFMRDGDTFWHIRTGQWIFDHLTVPTTDTYSYTAFGQRWIDGEWLSDVLFTSAYNLASWRGVLLLTVVAGAGVITAFCSYLLRVLRFSVAIGVAALVVPIASTHFLARPHIFSYVLLVLWTSILLDASDRSQFRPPKFVLSLMMVLWANLHGSFTIGLAVFFVFAAFAMGRALQKRDYVQCKELVGASVLVGCCGLLTPYGINSALLTLQMTQFGFVLSHVGEWTSPDFQTLKIPLALFIATFAVPLALGAKVTGPRAVLLALFTFLALSHFRGLIMFFLVAPLLVARPVAQVLPWSGAAISTLAEPELKGDPVLSFIRIWIVSIRWTLVIVVAATVALRWAETGKMPPAAVSAVDFVKRAGINGNVFNSQNFGAYLIFRHIPVFIDSRNPPYTDNFTKLQHDTQAALDIDKALQTLDDYDVKWLILVPSAPLAKLLVHLHSWRVSYSDPYSVILVRN